MDSNVLLTILIVCVAVFAIFAYVFVMIFYPEWVGITGKTALENQKSHTGETQSVKPEEPKDES
jgi:hypothetical protein